jgi:hypothetical protein
MYFVNDILAKYLCRRIHFTFISTYDIKRLTFQLIDNSNLMELYSTEIQVFVSCPGDVEREKQIVFELCEVVNRDLIETGCQVHLVPRDFSEVIAPIGTRPQQVINDIITDYHIYLGILYMRFGTPTRAINPKTSREFESGTEEEFMLAMQKRESGQDPNLIYFFFKDQEGSNTVSQSDQARKVLVFKEKLKTNNWINNFKTSEQFERKLHSLLYRITNDICNRRRTQVKNAFLETTFTTDHHNSVDINHFVPPFPKLDYYIARSLTSFKQNGPLYNYIFKEDENLFLISAVMVEKRIALLANAGSGKSVELQQTAKYFQDQNKPFIPIYKRLNSYTTEEIENFLPQGWNKVDSSILIILLDGLDEIQPQYFNTAVSKIISFSEQNPDLRLVISCRANFYEIPTDTFSGTLTAFKVFMLNDISLSEIRDYTTSQFNINGESFIQEAYHNSFLDLIQKPFFLNILIKHYKQNQSLSVGRTQVIEQFIMSRIDLDKEHFKTTVDVSINHNRILKLLQKVAFVMELTGRNFISDDELEIILPNSDEVKQIKYFSAFSKNDKSYWMFEHNNIQEFLACRVLQWQSFDQLIKIIAFAPSYEKVKPTWVNTISFYISTSSKYCVSELVDWLITKEPEIIIKFEPDRIDKKLRIQLFKEIFNSYKSKNIWLSSNKFSDNELSRFSSSTEALDFLIDEIMNEGNTQIVRLNAIRILENFNLDEFDTIYKENIRFKLLSILDENLNSNMVYSILYSICKMGLADPPTAEYLINKYRKRKNQYIRAGLYNFINLSNTLDQHIDYLLEGLDLSKIEDAVEDRESVNLADETFHLEQGLKSIKSPNSLRKAFKFFVDPTNQKGYNIYDRREIFEKLLQNAFEAYRVEGTLFNDMYSIYKTVGSNYEQPYIRIIVTFFQKIGKSWEVFNFIWNDDSIENDKDFLIEPLLDEQIVSNFIQGYVDRDFTNEDIERFYRLLLWHYQEDNSCSILEIFENRIKKISSIKLERPERVDWATINKRKSQESFNLLFDTGKLLAEIKRIFAIIGKTEIEDNDLWVIRKDNSRQLDNYFDSSALDLLRDFTVQDRTTNFEEVRKWIIENPNFIDYEIEGISRALHLNKLLKLTENQKEFIIQWSYSTASALDIENAITTKDFQNTSISVSWKVKVLWFFLNYFKISLPEQKILEFTLYYDFERKNDQNVTSTIETLQQYVSSEKIAERVMQNLSKTIPVHEVWKNNALYAIENNIRAVFGFILRDLKSSTKPEYYKSPVLSSYFSKTGNFETLQDLLKHISTDQLRWMIIKILLKDESQFSFLIDYLIPILTNEKEANEDKIEAAKYLMHIGDINGLMFIADLIFKNKPVNIDFHRTLSTIQYIKIPEAIPTLIRLLKIAKHPEFEADNSNDLQAVVFNGLYNIGIQSENNFTSVKIALENFIEENKDTFPNLNFIYFDIRKIEEQLYLKKSQSITIRDALIEFEKIK